MKRPAAAAESVLVQKPLLLGQILGQTGPVERKKYPRAIVLHSP